MSDQPKKPQKPQKLKARLPRGLADRGPAEIAATQAMLDTIARVYRLYGFEPVETPAMENGSLSCARSTSSSVLAFPASRNYLAKAARMNPATSPRARASTSTGS